MYSLHFTASPTIYYLKEYETSQGIFSSQCSQYAASCQEQYCKQYELQKMSHAQTCWLGSTHVVRSDDTDFKALSPDSDIWQLLSLLSCYVPVMRNSIYMFIVLSLSFPFFLCTWMLRYLTLYIVS